MSVSTSAVTLEQLVEVSSRSFKTVEEMVAAVIRSAIVSGIFVPGERLPQDRLAGLLEVSRMPIRSALRQLESEGLVELHAHRGATVRALSETEISDLYELRIMVETFALRRTVAAVDDAQLEELEATAAGFESPIGMANWFEARQDFYRALYSIGNTPRVVSTIMQFRAEVGRYTSDLVDLKSATHRDLLDRISSKDPDLAASWLEAHLRQVAQELKKQVAEAPPVRAVEGGS